VGERRSGVGPIDISNRPHECGHSRDSGWQACCHASGETEAKVKKLLLAAPVAIAIVIVFALPAAAKVGGQNGKIVFSRFTSDFSDSSTYIVNSGGGNPQALFPLFTSSSAHWSPNGTEVALGSGLDFPCCTGHTVIINPDTGAFRVINPEGPPA